MVIPLHRLPPGFAERVSDPPAEAATPQPAATIVLVRDGAAAPEVLLLKRHRASGFVPGAWVFPGGRVDEEDGDPALVAMLDIARQAADAPRASYWLAGIREVFEETGVLLARDAGGARCPDAQSDAHVAQWRESLMQGSAGLLDVLHALQVRPDASRMVYAAHWITPLAEPRRYDTRFFLAELPETCAVSADEREMSDAVWVTAAAAVDGFERGRLPMVFPTIKTIQRLIGYRSVAELIGAFRGTDVIPVLPRLVRTEDGVGIVVDEEKGEEDA
jgi:8-oxo-dGTP pyrophosphatase MutT (NUDIX family)